MAPNTRADESGASATLGCFSFYPGKNLGAYGEGGAVVTDDPERSGRFRCFATGAAEERYHHELKGFNYRMEGVQGAVLRVKMAYIEEWTESRRRLATPLRRTSRRARFPHSRTLRPTRRHVYHVYAIRTHDGAELQTFLNERGIAERHPLPDPGPPPDGVRRTRPLSEGTSRWPKLPPTRCSPCRSSRR